VVAHLRTGSTGPRVLLVMGLASPGAAWAPQRAALEADHQLLSFDHRGVGATPPARGRVGIDTMAADARALLDHVGWPDAHVVGISMGGMVAQRLALESPERVRSLALLATHAGGGLRALPPTGGLVQLGLHRAAARLGLRDAAAHHLEAILFSPRYRGSRPPGEIRASLQAMFGDGPPVAVLRGQMRAILEHDVRGRLPDLGRTPTLVVCPGRDRLVNPRATRALARGIPRADCLELPEAGHAVHLEAVEAVNAALRPHLRRAESR
jgi:3-oxoadipate enol-lactonase